MTAPTWPAVVGPGDPPIPTGPWAPNADMARLAELVADTDRMVAHSRDVVADVERALTAIRRPLVFPAPVIDPALREVA